MREWIKPGILVPAGTDADGNAVPEYRIGGTYVDKVYHGERAPLPPAPVVLSQRELYKRLGGQVLKELANAYGVDADITLQFTLLETFPRLNLDDADIVAILDALEASESVPSFNSAARAALRQRK